ncbi:hypothetical protein ACE6H2_015031 [Prunus campanulata]
MASSSKTFLLLGFMFALVILISSEVSARELVQNPYRGKPYIGCCPPTVRYCSPFIRPCPPPRPRRPPPPPPPTPTPTHPPPPPPTPTPHPRPRPQPGEYRHGQGHHEKPGPSVAETEAGN